MLDAVSVSPSWPASDIELQRQALDVFRTSSPSREQRQAARSVSWKSKAKRPPAVGKLFFHFQALASPTELQARVCS